MQPPESEDSGGVQPKYEGEEHTYVRSNYWADWTSAATEGNDYWLPFFLSLGTGIFVYVVEDGHIQKEKRYKAYKEDYLRTDGQGGNSGYKFVQGKLSVKGGAEDPLFGVKTNQPWLERKVEVYCWDETIKNRSDHKIITYRARWADPYIDSTRFRDNIHRNVDPGYKSEKFAADKVTCSGQELDPKSLSECFGMDDFKPQGLDYIYSQNYDPREIRIGDTRTSFKVLEPWKNDIDAKVSLMIKDQKVHDGMKGIVDIKEFIDKLCEKEKSQISLFRKFYTAAFMGIGLYSFVFI